MGRTKKVEEPPKRPRRKARTAEERENQLISMALDLVETRILNGTASGQELVQFIRMASSKNRNETEKTRLELELVKAKTENLRLQQRNEEMFANAIAAFKRYSGANDDEDENGDIQEHEGRKVQG